jgi:hypothetical protein
MNKRALISALLVAGLIAVGPAAMASDTTPQPGPRI